MKDGPNLYIYWSPIDFDLFPVDIDTFLIRRCTKKLVIAARAWARMTKTGKKKKKNPLSEPCFNTASCKTPDGPGPSCLNYTIGNYPETLGHYVRGNPYIGEVLHCMCVGTVAPDTCLGGLLPAPLWSSCIASGSVSAEKLLILTLGLLLKPSLCLPLNVSLSLRNPCMWTPCCRSDGGLE